MDRWAVFDIDGTLLPGTSMEQVFLRYVLSKRLIPLKNFAFFVITGLKAVIITGLEMGIKLNKSYLKGLPVSNVDDYAGACFQEKIVPSLSGKGMNTLNALRQEGYKILIVSGSPAFLTRRLDTPLRPDYILTSELEQADGRYTGRISGLHPYGSNKREILEKIQSQLNIDFAHSVVFANHHSDVNHMELFGRAVAVNPTPGLLSEAKRRTWEIEEWK